MFSGMDTNKHMTRSRNICNANDPVRTLCAQGNYFGLGPHHVIACEMCGIRIGLSYHLVCICRFSPPPLEEFKSLISIRKVVTSDFYVNF